METTQTRLTIIRYGVYFAIVIGALSLAYCGGGVGASVTSLTAEPATLTGSGVSTLKWTSTDAKLCNLNGTPVGSNDSYTTPELSSTTTYTLTCLGTDGDYVTEDITITVSSTAPTTEPTAPTTGSTTPTTEPTTPTTTIPITTTPPTTTTPITTTPTTTTTAPTTTTGTTTTSTTTTATTSSTYASVAAACAAAPRLSGTVHYYCDCGTGAQSGCVAGNDANAGTEPLLPRRTIGNAATFLRSSAAVNDTVALCKGGAFNATGTLSIGSTRCTAGTTCNDLREYTPTTFAGTAKPIINNVAGTAYLFTVSGSLGGVRLLNLKLVGDHGAVGNRNRGFFFYKGAYDVSMCNLDMEGFDVAVYNESDAGVNNRIKLTGSRFTNNRAMGYLGSGDNAEISYNYWDGNGSSTAFDHTIYLSGHRPIANVQIVGNYIHGQYGPTCLGGPLTVHGEYDGLVIDRNEIDIDAGANTNGGCWGIALNSGGYAVPEYFRHTSITRNIIRNGGNIALSADNCPGCLIENNVIIQDWVYGSGAWALAGISVPAKTYRAGDDVNTANIIRNNTIYFGPKATGGGTGITVKTQGTNHVIANNTVYYSATSAGQGVNCFAYPLALSSYAFINNNHCYSAAPYSWVATRGTLAAWRTYATSGFDSASVTGNTLFTAVGTNFTPAAGSILIGRGDAAHGATRDITGKARPSPPAIGAYER